MLHCFQVQKQVTSATRMKDAYVRGHVTRNYALPATLPTVTDVKPMDSDDNWSRLWPRTLFTDRHYNGWIGQASVYNRKAQESVTPSQWEWMHAFKIKDAEVSEELNLDTRSGVAFQLTPNTHVDRVRKDRLAEAVWTFDRRADSTPAGLRWPWALQNGMSYHAVAFTDNTSSFMPWQIVQWQAKLQQSQSDPEKDAQGFAWSVIFYVVGPGSEPQRISMGLIYRGDMQLKDDRTCWEPVFLRGISLDDAFDLPAHVRAKTAGPQLPPDPTAWLKDFTEQPCQVFAKEMYLDSSKPQQPQMMEVEGQDALAAWGDPLAPPTLPPGYRLFTYPNQIYTIAAPNLGRAVMDPVAPWIVECGAMGFQGRYVRMRICMDKEGHVSKQHMLELKLA